METAHSRALTDEKQRITYRASGLSFRQYNELYEKWLEHRYSDQVTTFTKRSPSTFDVFLTETSQRWRLETEDRVCAVARRLQEAAEGKGYLASLALIWRDLGRKKREELVLEMWEDMCTRAEEGEYIWSREETPELTLEFATGFDDQGIANWMRLWETQGQSEEEKRRSLEDPDALPYRNLRNEKWDRVNGMSDIEASAIPVKKSVRAFVSDGIGRRNFHLRQFMEELAAQIAEFKMETPPTSKHTVKYDAIPSDVKAMIKSLNGEGVSITFNERATIYDVCTYCHISRQPDSPSLHCSRCQREAKRIVRYCSSHCQQQHYPFHKRVCGQLLTIAGTVPSFSSSSEAARVPGASHLTSSPPPSSREVSTDSGTSALSLSSLSQTPSMDRSAWYHMLNNNPGSYWIACQGQPEDFDPRKRLNATPIDLPFSFDNRYETRQVMRSVAFSFINREDEFAVNLVLAFLHAENRGQEKEEELIRQVRWIAKLIGEECEDIDDFIRLEFPHRLTKGLHEIKNNEKYRLIRLYFSWKEAMRLEPDAGEVEYCTITSLIARDLNEDPEAIWYTCHPASPDKIITQHAMRITGPDLAFETENKNSKFAHTKDRLILTQALRRRIFRVLANPREDLDSLGILMLSISDPRLDSDRAHKWMLRRTSLDLGLPEELLEREMERMRLEVQLREGEEWDKIREAFEIIASQGSTMPPDAFPPLSITAPMSSQTPLGTKPQLAITSTDTTSDLASISSGTTKKKKKNKKKKKAKKSKGYQPGEQACESEGRTRTH